MRLFLLIMFSFLAGCTSSPHWASAYLLGGRPQKCEKYNPEYPGAAEEVAAVAGPEKDPNLFYLECMATHKNKEARYQLAMMYLEGDSVPQDEGKAVRLLKKAAKNDYRDNSIYIPGMDGDPGMYIYSPPTLLRTGLAKAKYQLALLYLHGRGVRQNEKKAKKYLERAAAQGYSQASVLLTQLTGSDAEQ